ncbi:hypothetical protein LTR56_000871 [Elasticomyces elasticus]|nr:hypothetical protein LTR56_000871 [Elasticomyces elasticus]KAK3665444.1 hypothetical protein LTR22_003674 [Elasticomyces elasticus]KAK4929912.1 hypothetical protein LTR49_003539 [Elasticomyces elasticus]KAK5769278.1 hypothetical protein LTS12_000629 [Elasticomyces elasticus]
MPFDAHLHNVLRSEHDPKVMSVLVHKWAKDSKVKKPFACFIQTELVNVENSKALEDTLGTDVRWWHRDFVMEHADFAEGSVDDITGFLNNRDPAIKQKARIALLILEIIKAAAVPGAEDALDLSNKTAKYRLRQAATLLLSITLDVQTRGYSSHFRKHINGKSIRPFKKIMLNGMLVQLKSITPPVATSQLTTVATANTPVAFPSQAMGNVIVNSLFPYDFFLQTTRGWTTQGFRNGIVDWVHEGDVFTVLVSVVKTELSDNENSTLLADRLTAWVSHWYSLFVKKVASFAEKKSTEIELYLESADPAGKQLCRLAQYVQAILKVAKVPGSKSTAYGKDMQPQTIKFRNRMIVTLLVTIVFDLQSMGSASHFIKLLEGRSMQPFPSIIHNGHPIQRSTAIREIPTALPQNFLDPLALITQPSAYQGPTASDGADMETTEVDGYTKGDDGNWLFREKSPEHGDGEQSQSTAEASKKKAKAAPKKKTDEKAWLVDSDDDDDEDEIGAALDVVADKKKAEALKALKSQTAIPKSAAATGSKSIEGTTARPVQQGRKRKMDDTGVKDNGDPKRHRTEGDTVPTAVHKLSHSTKLSAAAPAGFGDAGIATDGAVVGRKGIWSLLLRRSPQAGTSRVPPLLAGPARQGWRRTVLARRLLARARSRRLGPSLILSSSATPAPCSFRSKMAIVVISILP